MNCVSVKGRVKSTLIEPIDMIFEPNAVTNKENKNND